MKAIAENAASYVLDAIEYLRPSAIWRRSNEAAKAEYQRELDRLPVEAQRQMFAEEERLQRKLKSIQINTKLRESQLRCLIHQAEIVLGDD